MKLKDRGITVGDLLIFLVIIILTAFIFKEFKKNNSNNASLNLFKRELVTNKVI